MLRKLRWGTALLATSLGVGGLIMSASAVASANAAPSPFERLMLVKALPGFAPDLPGTLNGPLTATSLTQMGLGSPAILGALSSGQVAGYIRAWRGQGSNSGSIILDWVMRYPNGPDAVQSITSYFASVGAAAGPLSGIPDAYQAKVATVRGQRLQHSIGMYAVARGAYAEYFAMTDKGALTPGAQRSLVIAQFHRLPSPGLIAGLQTSSNTSGAYKAGEIFGYVLVAVFVIGLIAVIRSRQKRKRQSRVTSSPPASNLVASPAASQMGRPISDGPVTTVQNGPAVQVQERTQVTYCSWCGLERDPNSFGIHHCGSRDRPVVYCSGCVLELNGASFCSRCGRAATELSRH